MSPSSAATHNLERDLGKNAGGELSFSGDGTFSYDDEDDNVGFTVYKGHPYCEACHVRLRLPKCKRCKRPIRDHTEAVEALGGKWCWECFRCTVSIWWLFDSFYSWCTDSFSRTATGRLMTHPFSKEIRSLTARIVLVLSFGMKYDLLLLVSYAFQTPARYLSRTRARLELDR